MARDCEQLSPAAQAIFAKLKPFFPPDPWKRPRWQEEGIIIDNGTFDLRKYEDRKRLEEVHGRHIAFQIITEASQHQDNLDDYAIGGSPMSKLLRKHIKIVLILQDLDFQIETTDICEDAQQL
ncbi:MAG: hypothetical protein Q8P45_03295 [Candidatus Harrisonbacteria bacterium]|nr:hypothetical protein [Candidatus Harrisonbacteria bacterium]